MFTDVPKRTFSASARVWSRLRVVGRRLLNEGFGGYLLGISLAAASVCLIDHYLTERHILDEAVRNEIVKTVGTLQQPSDDTSELGLIAYALARINSTGPSGKNKRQECPTEHAACRAVEQLPQEFIQQVQALEKERRKCGSDVQTGSTGTMTPKRSGRRTPNLSATSRWTTQERS